MKKTILTFGLISGVILSAMMLLTVPFVDSIGAVGEIVGYSTMVLAGLLIYFGIRSYRDNVGGGTISFGRATSIGLLIVVVSTCCYVATWEVVYFGIAPSFQTKLTASMVREAKSKGGTPEQIDKRVAAVEQNMRMYQNPLYNAALTFLEPLPVGVILTLVSAGMLRRRRREGEMLSGASVLAS